MLAIRAADSATTVERPASLAQILADQLVARRVTTDLIGGFAAAAVALAALGMYGLLAVLVSSRRRARSAFALPSAPRLGRWPAWSSATACGTPASASRSAGVLSVATGHLISGLLVDVSPHDPVTLAVVVAALLAVACVAALLPARRAARIDPVDALRADG